MSIFEITESIEETIFYMNNSKTTIQDQFLTSVESENFYIYFLNNLDWQSDTAKIYGKTIITKRKIVWFADSGLDYNYSGTNRVANGSWNDKVFEIKNKLESQTGFTFNSCLLNLYHNGNEGMAWHSDDQNHLELNTPVAIVSLGAERFFKLREIKDKVCQHKLLLQKGSLLIMLGETQKHWQHEIPKMATIKEPRISLTFRTMKKK